MIKKLFPFIVGAGILWAGIAYATVFNSNQVGTNPINGTYLQTNGATSTWVSIPVASTTIINGVSGPTFTFTASSTGNALSITTSTAIINLLLDLSHYLQAAILSINGNTSTAQTFTGSSPISVSSANGNTTSSCPTCLTGNQTITLTGPITGTGTTSIATTIISPITVNVSTTQVTSTNINASTETIGTSTVTNLTANNFSNSCASGKAFTGLSATGTPTCTSFATSSGGNPAGSLGDVQFNASGTFGADSGNFDYSTSSKQLTLSTPTSSEVIGSSTYFSTSTLTQTFTASYTGSVASFTVPTGVTKLTIYVAAGGGSAENDNAPTANGEAQHSWVSTSTSVNSGLATSSLLELCGGGGGSNEYATYGDIGQGLNTQPDTYGGAVSAPTGGNGTCYISSLFTATSSGTISNGGNRSASNGGPGGAATGTITITPGTVFNYYVGNAGTSTADGGLTDAGPGSIVFSYSGAPILSSGQNFGVAVGNTIITGGSTPTVTAGTGSATVIGNNTAFAITNNSGTANTTLTFSTSTPYSNPAYFNAPICTATVASGTAYAIKVAATTSTVIFTPTSNFATGTIMNGICLGR